MSLQGVKVRGCAAAMAVCLACACAAAQYPGQVNKTDKNQPALRAIGVLEWTGAPGKPQTSRLIPVSVFDGERLQDGGIYLARPQPLAVTSDVEYELQENGRHIALYDIQRAGRQQGYWIGFGAWKDLPKPKPPAAMKASMGRFDDPDSDKPILHRKHRPADGSGKAADSGKDAPAVDPDRPTLHKKTSGGDAGPPSKSDADDDDTEHPTLRRHPGSGDSSSSSADAPAPDPDRPTLHKPKAAQQKDSMLGNVESLPNTIDPNRPRLMRGKPTHLDSLEVPDLEGMPAEMRQTVAVSDERTRPQHVWSFSWANPEDELKMKEQMETIARQALGLAAPPVPAAPKNRRKAAHRRPVPPAAPAPLIAEDFRVFELAYGTGATMVLTASSTADATPDGQKFVTLIAQPDLYGNVRMLFQSVADTAHLDTAPRMRLVDAVDAQADNRGELLFELRGAEQRQFALYRIYRGKAEQVFVTGGAAGHFD